MIEVHTVECTLRVVNFYDPALDFIDQDDIEGVFHDRGNVIKLLIEKVKDLNEVRFG